MLLILLLSKFMVSPFGTLDMPRNRRSTAWKNRIVSSKKGKRKYSLSCAEVNDMLRFCKNPYRSRVPKNSKFKLESSILSDKSDKRLLKQLKQIATRNRAMKTWHKDSKQAKNARKLLEKKAKQFEKYLLHQAKKPTITAKMIQKAKLNRADPDYREQLLLAIGKL